MIGTDKELLWYLMTLSRWHRLCNIDSQEAKFLKQSVRSGLLGHKRREELLNKFGATKIRDAVVIPSVWVKDGIELSSVHMLEYLTSKRTWYREIGMSRDDAKTYRKRLKNNTLREMSRAKLLTRLGCTKIVDSYELPAVWELVIFYSEPLSDSENIRGKIICNPWEL